MHFHGKHINPQHSLLPSLGKPPSASRVCYDGFRLTESSLQVMAHVVEKLTVDRDACARGCTDELRATERAYELVGEGVPFRDAYRRVAAELLAKRDPD